MPNGNGALHGPKEVEHAQDIVRHCVTAEFGTTNEIVVEVPGTRPVWHTNDAVSSSIIPTAYCELECAEPCERIFVDFPHGDDIFH